MSSRANRATSSVGSASLTAAAVLSRKAPEAYLSSHISIQRAQGGFVLQSDRMHHTDGTAIASTATELLAQVAAWAEPPAAKPAKAATARKR